MSADRRQFLRSAAAAAASAATFPLFATAKDTPAVPGPTVTSAAETAVKALYDTFTDKQKKEICFAWDHKDEKRGLLRQHVSNNWQITKPTLASEFFTKDQRGIVGDIFKGLVNPDWHKRFIQQLEQDNGGKPFGSAQSIALFGEPGTDKFEFVMTGRHQTIRADGNSEGHVAFGGPIFYGHAGKGHSGTEAKDHPDNVFWPQALAANKVYTLLDDKQKKASLVKKSPADAPVKFKGEKIKEAEGLAISGLTGDVKKEMQKVLECLIEPFRTEDRDEALAAVKKQGGLDACRLSFFEDGDLGFDDVWDNWRIEGPSFVWYFRGDPHVHVWVSVADDATVKANAK